MTTNKPKIELRAISTVLPYELNAKVHDTKQVDRIAKSIAEFGWDQPIVVDGNGVVIKGHGRRLAAIKLGLAEVPVWVRDDLTEEQVRASRLADNRVAISNMDVDLLQKELASLDFDMEGIFDKKELEFVMADLGELNVEAFVTDMDGALREQEEETVATLTAAAEKQVPISKALGFKAIKGKDERAVVMFMAQLEADTGKLGEEAFMAFIHTMTGAPA